MFQPIDISVYMLLDSSCDATIKELQEEKKTAKYSMENIIDNYIRKVKLEKMLFAYLVNPNPEKRMFDLVIDSWELQSMKLCEIEIGFKSDDMMERYIKIKERTMDSMENIKALCKHTGIYDL